MSRNFGHQIAITAGVELSRGATVVVMDSDLQDPPELIPEMYERYRDGFDVVYAQRRKREGETKFKEWTAKVFYRLMRRMTNIDIPLDTGDFRLMSRRVVEDLKRLQEQSRFVRGLVTWVGYNQTPILYDRDRRYAGSTKYPLGKMMKFALDGITGFSSQPLRLASHAGLFFAMASLALMVFLTHLQDWRRPGHYSRLDVAGSRGVVPWRRAVAGRRHPRRVHRTNLRRGQAAPTVPGAGLGQPRSHTNKFVMESFDDTRITMTIC